MKAVHKTLRAQVRKIVIFNVIKQFYPLHTYCTLQKQTKQNKNEHNVKAILTLVLFEDLKGATCHATLHSQ